MNKYIFTFGSGQEFEGFYQPIYSETFTEARKLMYKIYGNNWSSQYSEREWKEAEKEGYAIEQPLKALYCEE